MKTVVSQHRPFRSPAVARRTAIVGSGRGSGPQTCEVRSGIATPHRRDGSPEETRIAPRTPKGLSLHSTRRNPS